MRLLIYSFLALFIFSGCNQSSVPMLETRQVFMKIPPQFQLKDLRIALGLDGGKPTPEDRTKAEKRIENLKPILKKARAAIVIGSSVFDYPGLLAHNRSFYREDMLVDGKSSTPGYSLYVGIYLKPDEGQGKYDFRIVYDNKGIIRSIEDVVWKS